MRTPTEELPPTRFCHVDAKRDAARRKRLAAQPERSRFGGGGALVALDHFMRAAATILFASVVGIHCSAPEDTTVQSSEAEAVPIADDEGRASRPRGDAESGEADPRWALHAEGAPPTLITSTAHGDDDALYATGTFKGSVTMGGDTLTSKGDDDVFLVRFDPDGRVAWTRGIGSTRAERAPRVTFAEGKVRILATTEGEVDCGSGATANQWSSGMFFYCLYGADGTAMGGGTFPTGSP